MIVETGHYALVLALALALVQSVLPIWGTRRRRRRRWSATAVPAALRAVRARSPTPSRRWSTPMSSSDFSLVNVVENSPFDEAADLQDRRRLGEPRGLDAALGADPGAVRRRWWRRSGAACRTNCGPTRWPCRPGSPRPSCCSSCSPPIRSRARCPAPIEGQDLNPLLQDPGLAIHPPLLYLGYVGFSIVFSFAAAALITGRIDAAWARYVRPWALLAWIFLTLGIAMGSYWAYYTLGWGGFWFWDPVENASLMPWLAGTALLHSRRRDGEARGAEDLDDVPRDPRPSRCRCSAPSWCARAC